MSFVSDVNKWAENAGLDVDKTLRATVLELGKEIIQTTPVDEGTARNNWFTGINRNPRGRRNPSKNGSGSISNLESEYVKFGMGKRFRLVNRIPYILKLEYGSSKQAPSGMLRLAVQKARRIIREKARQTR